LYRPPQPVYSGRSIEIQPHNLSASQGIERLNFEQVLGFLHRSEMKAMKVLRNIAGTAGLLYASYVLIASMKDVRRYIRISSM
jgi:hypothetical protein